MAAVPAPAGLEQQSRPRAALLLPFPPPPSTLSPWAWYSRCLQEHPIKTKLLTSSFLMGSGDVACQALTRHEKQQEAEASGEPGAAAAHAPAPYDWHRTRKFAFLGAVLIGPALHHWYSFLIRTFPAQTTAGALKRLALDQALFAPTFIPLFFGGLQFLDGNFDLGQIRRKLEADYVDTLIANWMVWYVLLRSVPKSRSSVCLTHPPTHTSHDRVPAMLVNFRFVPPHAQVLFSNTIGFGWNIFLSAVSHK